MAKTDNIFFRAEPALIARLKDQYGTAGQAASRITEALPYLRASTLDELKGKFTTEEIMFFISAQYGRTLDPQFATDKESMKKLVKDFWEIRPPDCDYGIEINQLLVEMNELTAAQCYFLFDYCAMYYKKEGINLLDYARQIT